MGRASFVTVTGDPGLFYFIRIVFAIVTSGCGSLVHNSGLVGVSQSLHIYLPLYV